MAPVLLAKVLSCVRRFFRVFFFAFQPNTLRKRIQTNPRIGQCVVVSRWKSAFPLRRAVVLCFADCVFHTAHYRRSAAQVRCVKKNPTFKERDFWSAGFERAETFLVAPAYQSARKSLSNARGAAVCIDKHINFPLSDPSGAHKITRYASFPCWMRLCFRFVYHRILALADTKSGPPRIERVFSRLSDVSVTVKVTPAPRRNAASHNSPAHRENGWSYPRRNRGESTAGVTASNCNPSKLGFISAYSRLFLALYKYFTLVRFQVFHLIL